MKVLFLSVIFVSVCVGCNNKASESKKSSEKTQTLTVEQANRLLKLPMKCIQTEFPNKPSQALQSAEDIGTPKQLHPAFYGCFDWHSSVHGHWVLVKLLNDFPNLQNRDSAILKLQKQITKENIQQEISYFNRKQEKSFERTYGWAWLLKLAQEIKKSNIPEIKALDANLEPLTQLIVQRYIEFLPKLQYPMRYGTHTNSAFGMSFAYDFAKFTNNTSLKNLITTQAKRLYLKDAACGMNWEPSGSDFLSPCLEEINLMRRVLSEKEFLEWCHIFMPQLEFKNYDLEVGIVSDRTDGHLVHLDGLNFSRAWILYGISKQYPERYNHLRTIADKHLLYSLPSIVDGNYEGEHWLASFALYALSEQ